MSFKPVGAPQWFSIDQVAQWLAEAGQCARDEHCPFGEDSVDGYAPEMDKDALAATLTAWHGAFCQRDDLREVLPDNVWSGLQMLLLSGAQLLSREMLQVFCQETGRPFPAAWHQAVERKAPRLKGQPIAPAPLQDHSSPFGQDTAVLPVTRSSQATPQPAAKNPGPVSGEMDLAISRKLAALDGLAPSNSTRILNLMSDMAPSLKRAEKKPAENWTQKARDPQDILASLLVFTNKVSGFTRQIQDILRDSLGDAEARRQNFANHMPIWVMVGVVGTMVIGLQFVLAPEAGTKETLSAPVSATMTSNDRRQTVSKKNLPAPVQTIAAQGEPGELEGDPPIIKDNTLPTASAAASNLDLRPDSPIEPLSSSGLIGPSLEPRLERTDKIQPPRYETNTETSTATTAITRPALPLLEPRTNRETATTSDAPESLLPAPQPQRKPLGALRQGALSAGELANPLALKSALARGADPNLAMADGDHPLLAAASRGDRDIVSMLLAGGANPDRRNRDGGTALMYASWNGDSPMVQRLLAGGATLDLANVDRKTALMAAASQGHAEIVDQLLKGGATPDATSVTGWTALMYAVWGRQVEAVKALLDHGANAQLRNLQGDTALDIAEARGFRLLESLLSTEDTAALSGRQRTDEALRVGVNRAAIN